MARQHLSNIDAALLHLDDPTNLMMITAVMIFESPIDFERLKATVAARLLGMSRFRQLLVWPRLGPGKPYWEDDPDFDLDYHLQRVRLGTAGPGDQAALQDVVSLLVSTPLDPSRPLWQFHLVENYAHCCALVLRFHHCIADGMALVHVILSLTDPAPDAPWPTALPAPPQQRATSRCAVLARPFRSGLKASRQTAKIIQQGIGIAVPPKRLRETGLAIREGAADLGRFVLLRPDPDTILGGELGVNKRVAWTEGIPLEEIKFIRRRLGGTVNDILLTVVAGALRRYLQDHGEPVDTLSIRVTVPVNMRPPGREAELGNQVGAVFVPLPISIADPACRLGEIMRQMKGRKDSLEAPVFFTALNILGYGPARIADTLINTFSTRATAVLTNVKGPPARLYLAGSPLAALLPWAPTTGRMGMALSILSYAGEVRLGVLTDEGLVPDPEAILAGFEAEFGALLTEARNRWGKEKE